MRKRFAPREETRLWCGHAAPAVEQAVSRRPQMRLVGAPSTDAQQGGGRSVNASGDGQRIKRCIDIIARRAAGVGSRGVAVRAWRHRKP